MIGSQFARVRPRPRTTALRMMWAGVFTVPILGDRNRELRRTLLSARVQIGHYAASSPDGNRPYHHEPLINSG